MLDGDTVYTDWESIPCKITNRIMDADGEGYVEVDDGRLRTITKATSFHHTLHVNPIQDFGSAVIGSKIR